MLDAKAIPDRAYLLSVFDYDGETGDLRWRSRPLFHFKTPNACAMWNARYAGKLIRSADSDGYLRVRLDYRSFQAHRIIFKILHDKDPLQIDHADLDKSNNRQSNLREADQHSNMWNMPAHADNKSGLKGVSFCKSKNKYRALITHRGVNHFLGYTETAVEASELYKAAALRLHGEFARFS